MGDADTGPVTSSPALTAEPPRLGQRLAKERPQDAPPDRFRAHQGPPSRRGQEPVARIRQTARATPRVGHWQLRPSPLGAEDGCVPPGPQERVQAQPARGAGASSSPGSGRPARAAPRSRGRRRSADRRRPGPPGAGAPGRAARNAPASQPMRVRSPRQPTRSTTWPRRATSTSQASLESRSTGVGGETGSDPAAVLACPNRPMRSMGSPGARPLRPAQVQQSGSPVPDGSPGRAAVRPGAVPAPVRFRPGRGVGSRGGRRHRPGGSGTSGPRPRGRRRPPHRWCCRNRAARPCARTTGCGAPPPAGS